MKNIDNVNERLGDDLKTSLKNGSTLRIAAAAFSLYAYEALRDELEQVEQVQFLFTSPTFIPQDTVPQSSREQRQFYIPLPPAESTLYGTEFEIRLRNALTQRAIARECADWVRRKVTFRANTSGERVQSLIAVDEAAAYPNVESFTTSDLGYARGLARTNVVTKMEGPPETMAWLDAFQQVWADEAGLTDVTEAVISHITDVYAENSPERIYFFILYNIFRDFLDELSDDVLPNDRTGYQDTEVWQKLYAFQRDAARGIINKLETYNGCILADSVGLGKTFTALAVIKYYELRNRRVLVLCPKKLAENWTMYNANVRSNIFVNDRFSYDVLFHTDLLRTRGYSGGIRLDQINWGNYDLVVIDESHNFRNADYAQEKESRYQRLLNTVIREGVQTKVLMLSATPVNNRFNDLRNQLQLAYEGESENLSARLPLSTSIEKVFSDAQSAFNEWSKLPIEERTPQRILAMLDVDFFTLLDAVTIGRSRKQIERFYDTAEIGTFPRRLPPRSERAPLSDQPGVPTFPEIFDQLQALNLSVYTPMTYVLASRRAKYEDLYNITGGTARNNLGQAGREQGLKTLMTTNLLKRLESSVEAFRLTVQRIEQAVGATLDRLEAHDDSVVTQVDDASMSELEELDESAGVELMAFGEKVRIDLADMDVESWRRDLLHDRGTLTDLIEAIVSVTPEHDTKLQRLVEIIDDKLAEPLNPGNRKVLVFSAFADTASYLYRTLAPRLQARGVEAGLITGGTNGAKTTVGTGFDAQQVMTMFSPVSKQRHTTMPQTSEGIDVLIGTDVISEGQNLQDCDLLVNYDIHWNPVRIIQRFGRIDRIGSTNEVIQLVNFWPDISLDEYINLTERVENRMVIADLAGTADDNVLTLEASNAAFRREQLRRLQDEVIDMEDVRTGVSITDLGLNDLRMGLQDYLGRYPALPQTPRGVHAVVPAAEGLPPGVIFALRRLGDGPGTRANRVDPYHLVYLTDEGGVVADHTQARPVLDLLREACGPHEAPIPSVATVFNTRTRDGFDMSAYSELLNRAVSVMVDKAQEQEVDSLFSGGPTTALSRGFSGLDDFELIAFVAVVDPAMTP